VVSISAGIDMSLFYPAGYIMDRWGSKFAIIPCFLIQAIGMALVPLTGSFVALTAVATLIGFGNGLGSGTMMTLGTDLAPPGARGEFLGVWRFIGDGGTTGAPLIIGSVADLVGLQIAPLVMSGSGLIAVFIFAFFVPETLKKKQQVTTG
jgi:MFS family permease